ncbi:hypothetical protein [Geotalea uraniireducens]|uniref:hypothetical protein n=1 Tax=Geotalea uraniireducens TaxID=351604 RepID=UPI002493497B|nr:hypothetical protein [Geotalea uraniireducens]
MSCEELLEVIKRGQEQYRCLQAEAEALLADFDACGNGVCEARIARRQECIQTIQDVDDYLSDVDHAQVELDAESREAVAGYRRLQEAATKRILELDALVIALAGTRMDSLRGQLAALSRGKVAYGCYERSGRIPRRHFDDIA